MREHKLKVGVSGVRGVVGEFLTPLLAADFAQAFGRGQPHVFAEIAFGGARDIDRRL